MALCKACGKNIASCNTECGVCNVSGSTTESGRWLQGGCCDWNLVLVNAIWIDAVIKRIRRRPLEAAGGNLLTFAPGIADIAFSIQSFELATNIAIILVGAQNAVSLPCVASVCTIESPCMSPGENRIGQGEVKQEKQDGEEVEARHLVG